MENSNPTERRFNLIDLDALNSAAPHVSRRVRGVRRNNHNDRDYERHLHRSFAFTPMVKVTMSTIPRRAGVVSRVSESALRV
jgi:hypothetical protein